jgi:hypothetical protein
MLAEDLHIGTVFETEWDRRPRRVVAFDATLVLYDAWLSDVPGWGLDSLNGTASYYALPTSMVLHRGNYLRTEDYTSEERLTHRPDLPLSLARSKHLDWPMSSPATEAEFPGPLLDAQAGEGVQVHSLNAAQIYIIPFGPKGGNKAPVLIEAKNGISFAVEELLWQGAQHQSRHLGKKKLTDGVGIYRSGIKDKIPTYYLWGWNSRAGI